MKKINLENVMYGIAEKYPKSIPVLDFIGNIVFRIGLAVKRIPCVISGCDEKYESSWNMPDDYQESSYCERCNAYFDVYCRDNSPWSIIYKYDSFWIRLSQWLEWNK